MRPRPIRPNVYLLVIRFGVVSSDWKFVLAATLTGNTVPFLEMKDVIEGQLQKINGGTE